MIDAQPGSSCNVAMRWINAAAIVMLSAAAWAEEVRYCTETDSTGFYWNRGAVEGERTGFKLSLAPRRRMRFMRLSSKCGRSSARFPYQFVSF